MKLQELLEVLGLVFVMCFCLGTLYGVIVNRGVYSLGFMNDIELKS